MDKWCNPLFYKGKKLSGGAARNVRIAQKGGMDNIIQEIGTQVWEAATLAANRAGAGKIIQMPKKKSKKAM